ncbi:hypothetical protein FIBSPDRAFT_726090 [Athelia psychrophila]|uniref:Uncharacterized protein n=1 Tax=Athelia psychrophila TaxID=1759441 RepID=A0A166T6R7_9AGAM|nr:hypothetical protein FIBSPDRAFT_726090 [Fibularhizoctonia sp. CBS 109695]
MPDIEREYVDLLFRASKKYASWDPEIPVVVGDWGRITSGRTGWAFWRRSRGTFLKEGNIFDDGKAAEHAINVPKEYGADSTEGVTWIVSENVTECDISAAAGGQTPALAQCTVSAGFKTSSGRGAILAMENDTVTSIDPPGSLRRLLDEKSMQGCVVVSQVHRCSKFARLLTAKDSHSVALGLSVEPPVSGVVDAKLDAKWVRSSSTGNFKSKVGKDGKRDYYPLFKLVSMTDQSTSSGMRGGELEEPPLPDAVPPWQLKEKSNQV